MNMRTMRYPAWADDFCTSIDLRTRINIHGPYNVYVIPIYFCVQAHPDTWPNFFAWHFHITNFAKQNTLQDFPVVRNSTDINPVIKTLLCIEWQTFFHHQGKQLTAYIERNTWRNQIYGFRFKEINTSTYHVRTCIF